MPWQTESGDDARDQFKYQYHPGGDPRNPPKNAPSALHSVIIPNVELPKVCTLSLCGGVGWGDFGWNWLVMEHVVRRQGILPA